MTTHWYYYLPMLGLPAMFDIAWQELVFSLGGIIFFIALLPSILSSHKPDFKTCFVTACVITLFIYAFASLNMWVSMFGQALVGCGWWILTVQTFRQQVAERKEQRALAPTQ